MEEVEQNRLDRLRKLSNLKKETRLEKKMEKEEAWNRFLKNTLFGREQTTNEFMKSGKHGEYKKRLITKWEDKDAPRGTHLTIKDVADYLEEQGVSVEMVHPSDEYQGRTWEEVLKKYNHKELLDLHRKIFDLQYISSDNETVKASKKYKKTRIKKKKNKKKKTQKGGYPQWFDDVPKGMSRKKYLRLKKSKPKNKSMKLWIKENKKVKITRKRKVQKGGFPCLTCLSPIFATAAGLGTTGIMMSSSSSSININGRKSVKRQEKYQITKNGKTHKREFKQMNKRVYDGKKMSEYDNLKEANEAYNDLIKKCKSKGFQKC